MRGQILDAAVTSNRGLILGDDGARYTFAPAGWRDNSVKAAMGMRVEFSPHGAAAMDVSVIQSAPQPVPAPPPPFQAPAYPAPSQPPPQPAPPQTSQVPLPDRASQPLPQRPDSTVPAIPVSRTPMPHSTFVPRFPRAEESKSTVALLLIFLGPLGLCISIFYMKSRPEEWIPILVITVPAIVYLSMSNNWVLLAVTYIGFLIVGILLLMMSQEKWNRNRHFSRDHTYNFLGAPRKEPDHCRTGVCRPDGPQDA